jgi:hypothetical protein
MLGTIDLNADEAVLLGRINFDTREHDAIKQSCAASAELMPLLLDRDAIPAERLAYFTDPDCFDGKRSRLNVFEGNGTRGDEVFEHPNFLKHLRYFVHGSGLPLKVKQAMREVVGDPESFTSGDLEPVRVLARKLVRQEGLNITSADAFFQLTLDLGLSPDQAHSVQKAVKSTK